MVKHNQTVVWVCLTIFCLIVFYHFVGLSFKGLKRRKKSNTDFSDVLQRSYPEKFRKIPKKATIMNILFINARHATQPKACTVEIFEKTIFRKP